MNRHPYCPECVTGTLAKQRWYPARPLAKYPHLLRRDAALWTEFLSHHGPQLAGATYDTHLGPAWPGPTPTTPDLDAIRDGLTRYRVDVVTVRDGTIYVVEAKPSATLTALGQALGYAYLLAAWDPQDAEIIPCVLTDWVHPALHEAAEALGVALWTP